jgi:hypothetical protein
VISIPKYNYRRKAGATSWSPPWLRAREKNRRATRSFEVSNGFANEWIYACSPTAAAGMLPWFARNVARIAPWHDTPSHLAPATNVIDIQREGEEGGPVAMPSTTMWSKRNRRIWSRQRWFEPKHMRRLKPRSPYPYEEAT